MIKILHLNWGSVNAISTKAHFYSQAGDLQRANNTLHVLICWTFHTSSHEPGKRRERNYIGDTNTNNMFSKMAKPQHKRKVSKKIKPHRKYSHKYWLDKWRVNLIAIVLFNVLSLLEPWNTFPSADKGKKTKGRGTYQSRSPDKMYIWHIETLVEAKCNGQKQVCRDLMWLSKSTCEAMWFLQMTRHNDILRSVFILVCYSRLLLISLYHWQWSWSHL